MNKGQKILIGVVAIIILIIIIATATILMSPYGGLITSAIAAKVAPVVEPSGTGCGEDIACVTQLAEKCEIGNSQFSDNGIEGLMQIIGEEERGCKVYIRIDKHPDIPSFILPLDSTCWFAPEDVAGLDPSTMDIASLDCEGTLYEAAKSMN